MENESVSPDTLSIALRYAHAGYKILPLHSVRNGKCSCGKERCESAGKHPRLSNGANGASSDAQIIEAWLKRWPDCNIGMTLAGLVAVDIDPRHAGDATWESLIARNGAIPDTPTQQTGGGGYHYLFRERPNTHYKGGMGAGVDLKHGGSSFIVVEPSMHASGNRYVWLDESGPYEGGKPALAPIWIAGAAESNGPKAQPGADKIISGGRNSFIYERCRRLRDLSFRQDEIVQAALALNRSRCVPPLDDNEVYTIAKSAALNEPETVTQARFVDGAEFAANITPPHWLIDGVIQRSYLYGLTAPTNHGKTALAALIAVSVAIGKDFANQQCDAGHVLYLAGENPEDFKLRLRGACQANSIAVSDIAGKVTVMPCVDRLTAFLDDIKALCESKAVSLIIVDTSVAYFSYQDENANVDIRLHAQDLRMMIGYNGAPAVVTLCHPVKNAPADNLTPRGGSAFINELDCNLTLWKDGEVCELSHNKLRGPPFNPMQFKLLACTLDGVLDTKGRPVVTVVTRHMNESEANAETDQNYSDAVLVLRAISKISNPSMSGIAEYCEWRYGDGRPNKSKVQRCIKSLLEGRYVLREFGKFRLTEKGRNAIN